MRLILRTIAALALVASIAPVSAATIDTGAPDGNPVGAYLFDANDWYAGQVRFAGAAHLNGIFAHVLGGTVGDTFTIVLYDDLPTHKPGNALFSSTATFLADGWNGASGLAGWNVAAGLYWVAFEVGFGDTLGAGALLDRGVPRPLALTAFDPGTGSYQVTAAPLGFGLQVDATIAAVPEPGSMALFFAGAAVLLALVRRRGSR